MADQINTGAYRHIAMFLAVFLYFSSHAQKFSNLYHEGRPTMLFGSITELDNEYYVTGVTKGTDSPYYQKMVFGSIKSDGQVNFMKIIIDTANSIFGMYDNNLKLTFDGGFLASGIVVDTSYRALLIKVDNSGNIKLLRDYYYQGTNLLIANDIIELPSGYLLAINANFVNGNSEVLIIRTDTAGNVLNSKLHGLGSVEWPWLIRPMLNGNYMVGAFTRKSNTTTPFWTNTWLIEIDSMGNKISQWKDNDSTTMYPRGMQQTADSGWIIARQYVAYDNGPQYYNASLLKLDKNFKKEWELRMGDSGLITGFYDVEVLPDGNFIVGGVTPTFGHDSAYRWGWLLKVDTGGRVLWDRKYTAHERFSACSYVSDVDILPNGDILVGGQVQYIYTNGIYPVQQGWIMRTDSNGCLIDQCWLDLGDEKPDIVNSGRLLAYPNPANGRVHISAPAEYFGGALRIYDITGQEVFHQPISENLTLDMSHFIPGLYVITLSRNGVELRTKLVVE